MLILGMLIGIALTLLWKTDHSAFEGEVVKIPKGGYLYKYGLKYHGVIMSERERPAFYCPVRMSLSYHPKDVEFGWCENCQKFFEVKGKVQ